MKSKKMFLFFGGGEREREREREREKKERKKVLSTHIRVLTWNIPTFNPRDFSFCCGSIVSGVGSLKKRGKKKVNNENIILNYEFYTELFFPHHASLVSLFVAAPDAPQEQSKMIRHPPARPASPPLPQSLETASGAAAERDGGAPRTTLRLASEDPTCFRCLPCASVWPVSSLSITTLATAMVRPTRTTLESTMTFLPAGAGDK